MAVGRAVSMVLDLADSWDVSKVYSTESRQAERKESVMVAHASVVSMAGGWDSLVVTLKVSVEVAKTADAMD